MAESISHSKLQKVTEKSMHQINQTNFDITKVKGWSMSIKTTSQNYPYSVSFTGSMFNGFKFTSDSELWVYFYDRKARYINVEHFGKMLHYTVVYGVTFIELYINGVKQVVEEQHYINTINQTVNRIGNDVRSAYSIGDIADSTATIDVMGSVEGVILTATRDESKINNGYLNVNSPLILVSADKNNHTKGVTPIGYDVTPFTDRVENGELIREIYKSNLQQPKSKDVKITFSDPDVSIDEVSVRREDNTTFVANQGVCWQNTSWVQKGVAGIQRGVDDDNFETCEITDLNVPIYATSGFDIPNLSVSYNATFIKTLPLSVEGDTLDSTFVNALAKVSTPFAYKVLELSNEDLPESITFKSENCKTYIFLAIDNTSGLYGTSIGWQGLLSQFFVDGSLNFVKDDSGKLSKLQFQFMPFLDGIAGNVRAYEGTFVESYKENEPDSVISAENANTKYFHTALIPFGTLGESVKANEHENQMNGGMGYSGVIGIVQIIGSEADKDNLTSMDIVLSSGTLVADNAVKTSILTSVLGQKLLSEQDLLTIKGGESSAWGIDRALATTSQANTILNNQKAIFKYNIPEALKHVVNITLGDFANVDDSINAIVKYKRDLNDELYFAVRDRTYSDIALVTTGSDNLDSLLVNSFLYTKDELGTIIDKFNNTTQDNIIKITEAEKAQIFTNLDKLNDYGTGLYRGVDLVNVTKQVKNTTYAYNFTTQFAEVYATLNNGNGINFAKGKVSQCLYSDRLFAECVVNDINLNKPAYFLWQNKQVRQVVGKVRKETTEAIAEGYEAAKEYSMAIGNLIIHGEALNTEGILADFEYAKLWYDFDGFEALKSDLFPTLKDLKELDSKLAIVTEIKIDPKASNFLKNLCYGRVKSSIAWGARFFINLYKGVWTSDNSTITKVSYEVDSSFYDYYEAEVVYNPDLDCDTVWFIPKKNAIATNYWVTDNQIPLSFYFTATDNNGNTQKLNLSFKIVKPVVFGLISQVGCLGLNEQQEWNETLKAGAYHHIRYLNKTNAEMEALNLFNQNEGHKISGYRLVDTPSEFVYQTDLTKVIKVPKLVWGINSGSSVKGLSLAGDDNQNHFILRPQDISANKHYLNTTGTGDEIGATSNSNHGYTLSYVSTDNADLLFGKTAQPVYFRTKVMFLEAPKNSVYLFSYQMQQHDTFGYFVGEGANSGKFYLTKNTGAGSTTTYSNSFAIKVNTWYYLDTLRINTPGTNTGVTRYRILEVTDNFKEADLADNQKWTNLIIDKELSPLTFNDTANAISSYAGYPQRGNFANIILGLGNGIGKEPNTNLNALNADVIPGVYNLDDTCYCQLDTDNRGFNASISDLENITNSTGENLFDLTMGLFNLHILENKQYTSKARTFYSRKLTDVSPYNLANREFMVFGEGSKYTNNQMLPVTAHYQNSYTSQYNNVISDWDMQKQGAELYGCGMQGISRNYYQNKLEGFQVAPRMILDSVNGLWKLPKSGLTAYLDSENGLPYALDYRRQVRFKFLNQYTSVKDLKGSIAYKDSVNYEFKAGGSFVCPNGKQWSSRIDYGYDCFVYEPSFQQALFHITTQNIQEGKKREYVMRFVSMGEFEVNPQQIINELRGVGTGEVITGVYAYHKDISAVYGAGEFLKTIDDKGLDWTFDSTQTTISPMATSLDRYKIKNYIAGTTVIKSTRNFASFAWFEDNDIQDLNDSVFVYEPRFELKGMWKSAYPVQFRGQHLSKQPDNATTILDSTATSVTTAVALSANVEVTAQGGCPAGINKWAGRTPYRLDTDEINAVKFDSISSNIGFSWFKHKWAIDRRFSNVRGADTTILGYTNVEYWGSMHDRLVLQSIERGGEGALADTATNFSKNLGRYPGNDYSTTNSFNGVGAVNVTWSPYITQDSANEIYSDLSKSCGTGSVEYMVQYSSENYPNEYFSVKHSGYPVIDYSYFNYLRDSISVSNSFVACDNGSSDKFVNNTPSTNMAVASSWRGVERPQGCLVANTGQVKGFLQDGRFGMAWTPFGMMKGATDVFGRIRYDHNGEYYALSILTASTSSSSYNYQVLLNMRDSETSFRGTILSEYSGFAYQAGTFIPNDNGTFKTSVALNGVTLNSKQRYTNLFRMNSGTSVVTRSAMQQTDIAGLIFTSAKGMVDKTANRNYNTIEFGLGEGQAYMNALSASYNYNGVTSGTAGGSGSRFGSYYYLNIPALSASHKLSVINQSGYKGV